MSKSKYGLAVAMFMQILPLNAQEKDTEFFFGLTLEELQHISVSVASNVIADVRNSLSR